MYSNGCECADLQVGQTCATATYFGVAGFTSYSRSGNLPSPNEENWWQIGFTYDSNPSYHPHLDLIAAPGTTMVMDVYSSCSLSGAGFGCTVAGDVGAPVGLASWDVFGGGDTNGNGRNNGGAGYSATPNVDTVWVHVRQTGGARTCASYTLNISDN
jgi:hypothetical protein